MYNNSYGYGVYKHNQVNIGSPYQMKKPLSHLSVDEETSDENVATIQNLDEDLIISQDIVYKAKEEAAILKREAELEAERILSEAEELLAKAGQKAKEEGYRHGEALAQQHYEELLAEAQDLKDRCKSEYDDTLNSLEQEIVDLVVNIAAKVLGEEIRNNQKTILGIVRESIKACSNHEHVILKVSAEDYDFVIENEEELRSMIRDLNELEVKKDGTLTKGSCIIDTGFGSADGSCDTLMESIKQAFLDLLQNV